MVGAALNNLAIFTGGQDPLAGGAAQRTVDIFDVKTQQVENSREQIC